MAIVAVELETSFESGDPSTPTSPHSQSGEEHSLSYPVEGQTFSPVVVGDSAAPPARHNTRMLRALALEGDASPAAGGRRSEVQHDDQVGGGSICWYGFSFWIPPNFEQTDSRTWRIITQWHEGSGSPPFAFHLDTESQGQLRFRRKTSGGSNPSFSDTVIGNISDLRGRWLDFVAWSRWSSGSDGFFQLWMNGTSVYRYDGRTNHDGSGAYGKQGLYGNDGLMYYDWWKTIRVNDLADYTADVATPGSVEPEPTPEPEPGDIIEVTRIIGNGNDDGFGHADGTDIQLSTNDIFCEPSADPAVRYNSGTIYRNFSVPEGRIRILEARWRPVITTTFNDDPNLTIRGLAEDSPAAWGGDRDFNPSTYNFVSNSVDWVADTIGAGEADSPDIAPIIQQIVDNDTWDRNTIGLFQEAHTTFEPPNGEIRFESLEKGNPSSLYVRYEFNPPVVIPELDSAVAVDNIVTLSYNTLLDESIVPSPNDFTVEVNETVIPVTSVDVVGQEVRLTLESPAGTSNIILLDYVPGDNPITSDSGGEAEALTNQPVANLLAPLVHLDASTLTLNDGDDVPVWNDKGANVNNAEQPTLANQPTYRAATFNGMPAVDFVKANADRLDLQNDMILGDNWTVLMATTLNGYDFAPQLGRKQDGADGNHRPTIYTFQDATAYLDDLSNRTFRSVSHVGQFGVGERALVSIQKHGTGMTVRINGEVVGTATAGTTNLTIGRVGGRGEDPNAPNADNWFTGEIAELVVYNRILDNAEYQDLENSLLTKYNLVSVPLAEIESESVGESESEAALVVAGIEGELLAPSNFRTEQVTSTSIMLAWNAAEGADAYDIERDSVIIAEDIEGTSYTDSGLVANTNYDYRIRSVKYE